MDDPTKSADSNDFVVVEESDEINESLTSSSGSSTCGFANSISENDGDNMTDGEKPDEIEVKDSDITNIVECRVCLTIPAPPIYTCSEGHLTCNTCMEHRKDCGHCGSPYTKVRNYVLESIIEDTTLNCKYASQGCHETISGVAAYKKHIKSCQHGPLTCNETHMTCCNGTGTKTIERNDYLGHLFTHHNACGKFVPSKKYLFGEFEQKRVQHDDFSPIYLQSGTNDVAFILKTKKYKRFTCWWVACLDPTIISKYNAKLIWPKTKKRNNSKNSSRWTLTPTYTSMIKTFKNRSVFSTPADGTQDSDDDWIQWTLPINHVNKPFEEIIDSGLCAVLPDKHVDNIATNSGVESEKGGWKICFQVKRIEQTIDITWDAFCEEFVMNLKSLLRNIHFLIGILLMIGCVAFPLYQNVKVTNMMAYNNMKEIEEIPRFYPRNDISEGTTDPASESIIEAANRLNENILKTDSSRNKSDAETGQFSQLMHVYEARELLTRTYATILKTLEEYASQIRSWWPWPLLWT